MPSPLQTWQRDKARRERDRPELSREERHALHKIRMEAKAHRARLASQGRGGLSPSLALTIFRRDDYTCKVCGRRGEDSGGLQLHHKGHLQNPASAWLAKKGKSNETNNIVTICAACHDSLHDADRAAGEE